MAFLYLRCFIYLEELKMVFFKNISIYNRILVVKVALSLSFFMQVFL